MDGGRLKWEKEGRAAHPRRADAIRATTYTAPERDDARHPRILRDEVRAVVRGEAASSWTCAAPRSTPARACTCRTIPNEGALRGGHIPGAKSVPWARAVNPDDGTFKSAERAAALYEEQQRARPGEATIVAYCRIGERSSHTWFALTYLLGFEKVRNYDGSWTEWGNLVGVPIEK